MGLAFSQRRTYERIRTVVCAVFASERPFRRFYTIHYEYRVKPDVRAYGTAMSHVPRVLYGYWKSGYEIQVPVYLQPRQRQRRRISEQGAT
jgi:hypothetical protein